MKLSVQNAKNREEERKKKEQKRAEREEAEPTRLNEWRESENRQCKFLLAPAKPGYLDLIISE